MTPPDAPVETARKFFHEGVGQFRAGNYLAAEAHFRQALELAPPRASVLTNLANTLLAQGKAADAVGFAERSVRLDETGADAWYVLGRCLESLGRSSEALESLDRAIGRDPMHFASRALRFDILARAGRHQDALADAESLVAVSPESAAAWYRRGAALNELGRHDEALGCYQESLRLDASMPSAWLNLGVTLCFLNRHGESLTCFDSVLRLQPENLNAWLNRGLARFHLGEPDLAIADYEQGLARDSLNAELWFNRGVVLAESGRHDEALACYDRALGTDPRYAEAWNNRGVSLKTLGRPAEALDCHDRAVACKADYVEAWTNRGLLLCESKHYEESLASYATALRIKPDHPDAHWNESLARLLLGQFELGWQKYSYRWKIHKANVPRLTANRLERPEDAAGHRILLWAEQGYGDTLQFCRYAPLLAARGARVFVEVQPPLKKLLGSLSVHGVFAHGDPLPEFDFQAALLDLPSLFQTGADNIPAPASYLRADPELVASWTARLPPRDGRPRIGICCSGNPKHANDRCRSMPLAAFAPLSDRAQLFLIQKDLREEEAAFVRAHPDLPFLGDQIESFSDSAAIIASMDLVISVDTSLAHLAGALGKAVWILLPWAPEWRWMLDRADSPWYPSARLFRQSKAGDWSSVIAEVMTALDRGWPIAQAPDPAMAWYLRGLRFSQSNRHPEALPCYRESLRLDASNASAWLNLGVTLCFLNQHEESLPCFDTVLCLQPDDVNAWQNRGLAHFALDRPQAAIADYDQGLACDPGNAELWFNRGVVLAEIKRSDEAVACYQESLRLDESSGPSWLNLGVVLVSLERREEAIVCFDRVLRLQPDDVKARRNRVLALLHLGRYHEALAEVETELARDPRNAEAWVNRGAALYNLKRHQEALESYAQAQRLEPDLANAHWNESLARLVLGQFELGWRKYAYRWRVPGAAPRLTANPLERLQDAPGRRVLLWSEQGYGDTLHFCRYAALLAARGAQVLLEVQWPLKELLDTLEHVDGVFARGEALPAFDLQASLLDLPGLFDTRLDGIPARTPYLSANPARVGYWRDRLPASDGALRIGLCCSGNPQHLYDAQRSVPLATLKQLRERAQIFLIQKDLREADAEVARSHPDLHFLGESIRDFADSAALVELMDLIISVDASLAHLAGALGKAVWILLPWAPEWRWMLDRTDCPWYPTATLFRQGSAGDWGGVVQRLAAALDALTLTPGPSPASGRGEVRAVSSSATERGEVQGLTPLSANGRGDDEDVSQ